MQFEVEHVLLLSGRNQAYVLARQVTPGGWTLSPSPTLGDVPIRAWTDIPRALDADGGQRMDLFAFCLCDASDSSRLCAGQVVELHA